MIDPKHIEFRTQSTLFFKFLNDQKMNDDLKRKATLFYNKVIYSYGRYSLDISFYTNKLREAQGIIYNSDNPDFLKNEMDRLNSEIVNYINDPLISRKNRSIAIQIASALFGVVIVALGIVSAILCPAMLTHSASLIKAGIGFLSCLGVFGIFKYDQRKMEQEIHSNMLVVESSNRQTVV